MKTRALKTCFRYGWLVLALAAWPATGSAQVAVADIEEIEEFPIASASELETLVGPIALYPDDLLAIVLPASTFPLQIIEAARFLQDLKTDSSLKPDEDWDDSVVALLNYPEVVELLNEDLDWSWRLGEVVVAQQSDVISAIELFRDRAYAAGNLKSDDYQLVAQQDSAISITPVQEDVIYVPYYEPARVVVYQPQPVYFYYPRSYPVYYYPYSSGHYFDHGYFWGVTTAYSIGWHDHYLNTYHHSFYGHPYYGHSYWDHWYRRPDIHVYNNVYVRNNNNISYDRYRNGDRWQPSDRRTVRSSDQRITRTRYYPSTSSTSTGARSTATGTTSSGQVARSAGTQRDSSATRRSSGSEAIDFRNRESERNEPSTSRSSSASPANSRPTRSEPSISTQRSSVRQEPVRQSTTKQTQASPPKFRPRNEPAVRSSSQPKQSAPAPRQSAPAPRQSAPAPRQSAPRHGAQSAPRQSAPKPSQPSRSNSSSSSSKSSSPRSSKSSSSKSSSSKSGSPRRDD